VTDNLQELVVRLPPKAGRANDVRLPLGRRPFTTAEARALLADTSLVEHCLSDAAQAHQQGNPVALLVAVRLLRARSDLHWPRWVSDAVLGTLEKAGHVATAAGMATE
jgi:hypothetical protein